VNLVNPANPVNPRDPTTIIVPTYKEAENIPHLIDRIAAVRQSAQLDLDLLLMDDHSQDGSAELVAARSESWVHFVDRTDRFGLSAAVLDGFRRSHADVLVCMDADLSHPPEAIPQLIAKLDEGADFVFGSRYVAGGTTSDDWGVLRWLNSRAAILLARPLTSVRDPMAGFFALRRSTFERATDLDPIGYKIGLELIVRCRCERVVEVPIHFEDRRYGQSKLGIRQQLLYLEHLRRLYLFKNGAGSPTIQFLIVGGLGTIVNLSVLTALLARRVTPPVAVALAIISAMGFNFVLNRSLTIAGSPPAWPRRLSSFVVATSIGGLINYGVTLLVMSIAPRRLPQLAALAGIAVGTAFNFIAAQYLAFRAARVRPRR
jgi:dolichol-phosphate mannosyltransferase